VTVDLLSLILLACTAGAGSGLLSRRLAETGGFSRLERNLARATLWAGWMIAAVLLAATAALLTGLPLVRPVGAAAASIIGWLAVRIRRLGWQGRPKPVDISAPRPDRSRRRLPAAFRFLVVGPVLLLHVFLACEAMTRPPAGFDGLHFHLPLVVRWVRDGQLSMVEGVWQFSLPGNGEVWMLLIAWLGVERLIELSMLPIGGLAGLLVFGIARELSASRPAALLAAVLALAGPMTAMQCYSSYVDCFGAAFILAGVYWTIRMHRGPAGATHMTACALPAGTAVGLAIGTKPSFVLWAGLVVVAMAAALVGRARREAAGGAPAARRQMACAVLAFTLAAGACCFYWPLRAAFHTGWPLYPIQLRVAGGTLGSGLPAERIVSDLGRQGWWSVCYPWVEWKRAGHQPARGEYAADNGLGPAFAAFAVPGALYLLLRRRLLRRPGDLATDRTVLGLMGAGGVLFVEACFSYGRYAMPLWMLALAACGPMLDMLVRLRPRSTLALACPAVVLSSAMMTLAPAVDLAGRLRDGDLGRSRFYGLPPIIERLEPGAVVLNLGDSTANYPLYGQRWTNRVIETPLAAHLGLKPPLTAAQIGAHGIDYVYIRDPSGPPFADDVAWEIAWDDRQDPARPPTTRPTVVYRLLRAGPGAPAGTGGMP